MYLKSGIIVIEVVELNGAEVLGIVGKDWREGLKATGGGLERVIIDSLRGRHFSLGNRYWEKKAEASTIGRPVSRTINNSTLPEPVSSPLVIVEEMTELRSPALKPLR